MSLGKIILKSTTRISLNDRFTVLRQEKPSLPQNGVNELMEEHRQNIQATRRNQRLAAQMERRPAVMAALKTKKNIQNRINGQQQQQVSVKQRLAMPGRLRVPEGRRGMLRGMRRPEGNLRGRGGRGIVQSRINVDNRPSFRGQGRFHNPSFNTRGGRGGQRFSMGRGRGRGRGRGFASQGRGSFSRTFGNGV